MVFLPAVERGFGAGGDVHLCAHHGRDRKAKEHRHVHVQAVEILEFVQLGLGADGREDGAVIYAEFFGLDRAPQRGARA